MVQRINKTTYRCRLCKTIYTSMKRALECERSCLDDKKYYELKPVQAILKIDGKKHKVWLAYKVRKWTEVDTAIYNNLKEKFASSKQVEPEVKK